MFEQDRKCPSCGGELRVHATIASDGSLFEYYLCAACEDVVRRSPKTGRWELAGERTPAVGDLVRRLEALAADDWQARATSRAPRTCRLSATLKTENPGLRKP